jgi:hypothetical protein
MSVHAYSNESKTLSRASSAENNSPDPVGAGISARVSSTNTTSLNITNSSSSAKKIQDTTSAPTYQSKFMSFAAMERELQLAINQKAQFEALVKKMAEEKALLEAAVNFLTAEKDKVTTELAAFKAEAKEESKAATEKLKLVQNIGQDMSDKMAAASSLITTLENFFRQTYNVWTAPTIHGSLIRQMFEVPTSMASLFSDNQFGNSIGRDVDLFVSARYPTSPKFADKIRDGLKELSLKINQYLRTSERLVAAGVGAAHLMAPLEIGPFTIKKFEHIDVRKEAKQPEHMASLEVDVNGIFVVGNNPHYIIEAQNSNGDSIVFDLMGWPPKAVSQNWEETDFDVNSFYLNKKGLTLPKSCEPLNVSALSIINHIQRREAQCLIDLERIHGSAWEHGPREERVDILKKIAHFLTHRTKILAAGYNVITSTMPILDLSIEKEEPCIITSFSAPYVQVTLKCGHQYSVMAYMGQLVCGDNPDAERINCAFCRATCQIKFSDKLPTPIPHFEETLKKENGMPAPVERKQQRNLLFSSESQEYLNSLKPKQITRRQTRGGGQVGSQSRHHRQYEAAASAADAPVSPDSDDDGYERAFPSTPPQRVVRQLFLGENENHENLIGTQVQRLNPDGSREWEFIPGPAHDGADAPGAGVPTSGRPVPRVPRDPNQN